MELQALILVRLLGCVLVLVVCFIWMLIRAESVRLALATNRYNSNVPALFGAKAISTTVFLGVSVGDCC